MAIPGLRQQCYARWRSDSTAPLPNTKRGHCRCQMSDDEGSGLLSDRGRAEPWTVGRWYRHISLPLQQRRKTTKPAPRATPLGQIVLSHPRLSREEHLEVTPTLAWCTSEHQVAGWNCLTPYRALYRPVTMERFTQRATGGESARSL